MCHAFLLMSNGESLGGLVGWVSVDVITGGALYDDLGRRHAIADGVFRVVGSLFGVGCLFYTCALWIERFGGLRLVGQGAFAAFFADCP